MNLKKGQLEISFGMIFSIILVIAFLGFGFYAITKFIEMQQTIQIEKFASDFQEDVNTVWKSLQGSQTRSYTLPKKIIAVCFINEESRNMKFLSERIISGKYIEKLDIDKILGNQKEFCIENTDGKVNLVISKEYGETLVTIKK
jgi:hypothetical protein